MPANSSDMPENDGGQARKLYVDYLVADIATSGSTRTTRPIGRKALLAEVFRLGQGGAGCSWHHWSRCPSLSNMRLS